MKKCLYPILLLTLLACSDAAKESANNNNDPLLLDIVQLLSPLNNEGNVARDATVMIEFTQGISSLPSVDDLAVFDSDGNIVDGNVSHPDNKTLLFTPNTPLNIGASYTAQTNANLSFATDGAIGQALNWTFTTRDGAWTGTARITAINAVDDERAQLHMPSQSILFLTWERTDINGISYFFTSQFGSGSNVWSAAKPTSVTTGNFPGVRHEFKFNQNGSGALTWITQSLSKDAPTNTYYKRYNGNWLAENPIASGSFSTQITNTLPSLALDNNNGIHLAWYRSVPGINTQINTLVSKQVSSSGVEVDRTIRLCANDLFSHYCGQPIIDVTSNGESFVAYVLNNSLVGSSFSGANWQDDGTIKDVYNPKGLSGPITLSTTADNIGIMVWIESTVGNNVWVNRRTPGNTNVWQNALPLDNQGNGSAASPKIAHSSSDHIAVTWSQNDSTNAKHIWANIYANGSWLGARKISSNDTVDAPDIAIDKQGNALAVWQQSNGSNTFIWSARYINGSWQPAEQLSENVATDANDAKIIVLDNGEARAVWSEDDGISRNLVERVFQ